MAPLNLPPPAITLDEAKELVSYMEQDKGFINKSFQGSALAKLLQNNANLNSKLEGKTPEQIGQALLDHRLVHHVTDDAEFSLDDEFRLLSQEKDEVRKQHAQLDEWISTGLVNGKVMVERSYMLGFLTTYDLHYAVLGKDKLRIFKRQSAASGPEAVYDVSSMSQVKECIDCKEDWYCFEIKMKNGSKLRMCADHSKRQETWMAALTNLGIDYAQIFDEGALSSQIANTNSLYELSARRLNSKEVTQFSAFKGDVCLIVNVSTLCGLTPQYAELQTLFEKYKDQGFRILAFPVNQFNNQEPGTETEIAEFAKTKFNVTFDMFEKTDCNGKNAHPVFRFVKGKLSGVLGSSVKWNFTKFLCDRNGIPIRRYAPTTKPMSFEDDIIEILKQ